MYSGEVVEEVLELMMTKFMTGRIFIEFDEDKNNEAEVILFF